MFTFLAAMSQLDDSITKIFICWTKMLMQKDKTA